MTVFQVRRARPDDARAMAELLAAVAEERDGIATEPPVDVEAQTEQFGGSTDGATVAVVGSEIVGMLHLEPSAFGSGDLAMAGKALPAYERRAVGLDRDGAAALNSEYVHGFVPSVAFLPASPTPPRPRGGRSSTASYAHPLLERATLTGCWWRRRALGREAGEVHGDARCEARTCRLLPGGWARPPKPPSGLFLTPRVGLEPTTLR